MCREPGEQVCELRQDFGENPTCKTQEIPISKTRCDSAVVSPPPAPPHPYQEAVTSSLALQTVQLPGEKTPQASELVAAWLLKMLLLCFFLKV